MSPEVGISRPQAKLGPGRMVLVVGPSGAGKDTLLNGVKERLKGRADIHFARRAITRAPDQGPEDHDLLTEEDFKTLSEAGTVALAWQANGLCYVIPQAYDTLIAQGRTIIANGSRRALSKAREKYANLTILLITAPVEILAARLAERGRENRREIEIRLQYANFDIQNMNNVVRIENAGSVEDGVDAILKALAV